MKKIKRKLPEYDLAYICYYAEKIELSAIAAGFDAEISTSGLAILLQELKENGQFECYKKKYQELLALEN
ncbi:hypothetical protein ACT7C1_15655 [Bacillus paranthracis]|uniref:hypothetical protein n=1 Tax=Bacillus TaxID=1386 RepID=UPI0011EF2DF1|nr:hypothetical protein [Bacillus sp. BB56-3]KAA0781509.1 hypothetical protein DN406_30890 [Bacillus sp. BB56-3]